MAAPSSGSIIEAVETEDAEKSDAEPEADERWRLGNTDGTEGGRTIQGRNVPSRGIANSHGGVEGIRGGKLRTGEIEFCEPGIDPGCRGSAGEVSD